jgi:urease accessory protein
MKREIMLRAKKTVASGDWSGQPADSVVLEFDERYRQQGAMNAVGGLEFELALDAPAMLRGGDGLRLDDGRIVEVVAAPEPLIEIRAEPLALIRIALGLGNAHALVEATAKSLRLRRDAALEAMAKALGARVVPLEAPFNPEGAGYVMAAAHDHGRHDHGHEHHDHADHEHDHHEHDRHEHGHHEHAHAASHDHDAHEPSHPAHDHDSAVHHHRGEDSDD